LVAGWQGFFNRAKPGGSNEQVGKYRGGPKKVIYKPHGINKLETPQVAAPQPRTHRFRVLRAAISEVQPNLAHPKPASRINRATAKKPENVTKCNIL
jgi:hypothetical protein